MSRAFAAPDTAISKFVNYKVIYAQLLRICVKDGKERVSWKMIWKEGKNGA